ncbi:pimeloyl-ACP methyl ester carboxylesterase [Rathayibacter sp. PhB93]|uniref:alpha/beta hydrolase n=1 Tax=unclassified Rathayibacter TaxID=2609250 RepID=UPI000F4732C9|nr:MULTISPECIES: alpha/beta hydrolase [unclassified Rathayibacter]ROQ16211.1 pimeloyl-ACP methyl ester carboxylesterase [Rathayibacter sp. PhB93]TDQ16152.1 pimeloyl-ACP methyl ester carboxylesterase [Rathayibacter sp. PhB1]
MSSIPSDPSSPDLRHASRRPRPLLRQLLSVLATAVAVVLGLVLSTIAAAFALAVSLPFAIVVWVVLSLLLVFLLVSAVQRLLPRRPRPVRRSVRLRTPLIVAAVATAAVGALTGGTVLAPIGGSSVGFGPVAPQYWDLSTGSHVAYWKTAAPGPGGSDVPIVYLHGGPGAFVFPGDFDFAPVLAGTGHDVYMFDQAGAGYSSELPLGEYTLERSLADIDAVREQTGADRVILVGHSAGGFLAAAYAAEHPEHVEKTVFVSPGSYDTSAEGLDAAAAAQAAADERSSEAPSSDQPAPDPVHLGTQLRMAAASAVLDSVGSDAAAALLSQEDMKKVLAAGAGASGGLNLYVNVILNKDFEAHWGTVLSQLAAVQVPTLLVRAQYDYLDWRGQHLLAGAVPDAQTVYIPGAEHVPWALQHDRTIAAVSDFLLDRAQPIYTGDTDPGLADAPDRG